MACTVSALMTRACTSGIGKIFSKIKLLQIIAQLKTNCDNQLIYVQSNGVVTSISNPTGAYNLSAISPQIVSIRCRNAPNITSLTLTDDPLLIALDLQNCAALATLNFPRCTALASVNLNTFTSVTALIFEDCTALTSFSATSLTTVTSNFNIEMTVGRLAIVGNFVLPALTTVGGNFSLLGASVGSALTSVSLPSLSSVTFNLKIANNSKLTSISLPSLTTVGLDFNFSNNAILTSVAAGSLQTVASILNGSNNPSLVSVSFSNLTTTAYLGFNACFALTGITLTNLSNCVDIFFQDCSSLVSFSLPAMNTGTVLNCRFNQCASLTSYSHGLIRFVNAGTFSWFEAALDVTSVNAILVGAQASAPTSSIFNLTDGSNAAPTGAGIVAKAALITAGCTVDTN